MSRRAPARVWLFRLIALLGVPALLVAGLELGLRLAGVGRDTRFLIPDETPGHYRTNPDYLSLYLPGSFDLRPLNFRVARPKPPGTLRVVVLGESAAQGIPEPRYGFVPQLRAQLRARHPGREIEVINCGVVAINSHVVRRLALELARFEPDVFVVYLGNNEVVGPYAPGCSYLSAMPPRAVIRASLAVRATRTGQLLGRALGGLAGRGAAARAPAEWGGMAMFVDAAVRGDDPRLERVYANFAANLDDIIAAGRGAGAPVVLATVVSNLADSPPFLSLHRPGLTSAELAAWQRAYDRGLLAWRLGEVAAARRDLTEALALDPQHADTSWLLGDLARQAGDVASARRHFLEAQRWDALRFRPDPRLNELVRAAAQRPGVTLVDTARKLGSDPASSGPPAGRELLFEHVHLDWPGNFEVGRRLAAAVDEAVFGVATDRPAWLDRAAAAAAVGYTPPARAEVLRLNAAIVQQPPFSNQVTYAEDQLRLARDLAAARARARDPEVLAAAAATVAAAITADPRNPALAKAAQELADDRGDVAGALAELRRGQELQPENFALRTDEAIKLARLGRFAEAEALLRATYEGSPGRDRRLMAPAFADLFIRTQRLDEGRRFFDAALAAQPGDAKLLLLRARLARLARDPAAAEADLRAARAADPRNAEALEGLVTVLQESGRTADAEAEVLAATAQQPGNFNNHLRAELIADARGDVAAAIAHLRAAVRSGPATSAVHVRLARKLFNSGAREESLQHLAVALRLARIEEDPETAAQIARLLGQIRGEGG